MGKSKRAGRPPVGWKGIIRKHEALRLPHSQSKASQEADGRSLSSRLSYKASCTGSQAAASPTVIVESSGLRIVPASCHCSYSIVAQKHEGLGFAQCSAEPACDHVGRPSDANNCSPDVSGTHMLTSRIASVDVIDAVETLLSLRADP